MDLPETGHDPVLLAEVIEQLHPPTGGVFVDCTLGRGGHSLHVSRLLDQRGLVIGLDADPRNLDYAKERLAGAGCPVRLFHANFAELDEVLVQAEVPLADAILADLGISTNQLFDDAYGMSFARSMPLDMRIDPRSGQSAADIVNRWKEQDIADTIYQLANERHSRRIARKIVEARRVSPILTTERLADLVRSAIPPKGGPPEKIDPATRTFMALRMAVNGELENLARLLKIAPPRLKTGGRLGIISFHSGEDRMVKQAFRDLDATGGYRIVTKKPIEPGEKEVNQNPRARSAKLRVIERSKSAVN